MSDQYRYSIFDSIAPSKQLLNNPDNYRQNHTDNNHRGNREIKSEVLLFNTNVSG